MPSALPPLDSAPSFQRPPLPKHPDEFAYAAHVLRCRCEGTRRQRLADRPSRLFPKAVDLTLFKSGLRVIARGFSPTTSVMLVGISPCYRVSLWESFPTALLSGLLLICPILRHFVPFFVCLLIYVRKPKAGRKKEWVQTALGSFSDAWPLVPENI